MFCVYIGCLIIVRLHSSDKGIQVNQVFSTLLNEKIELFKYSFTASARQAFVEPATGKLFHPGEFGTYRESILREFLRLCVPARLDIGTGFLINASSEVSTQADVVIYDRSAVPRVESSEHQRFYPVEGVCAVGEVKSRLSKNALRDALNKLARVKAKADIVSSTIPIHRDKSTSTLAFDRETVVYDQLFSFLVCEGFDFDSNSLAEEVAGWYDSDIKNHHKHNMVLSIENGLLLYVDANKKSWMYPSTLKWPVKNRFVHTDSNEILHFHLFCSYMYAATTSATILFPEMTAYMPQLVGGLNYDES
jgi:hypothetical protein